MAIPAQTTYATDYAIGLPGMVANGEESNRISRTVEDVAGIAFGKAAFRGAGDHGCTATPAADAFMGIAIADRGVAADIGAPADTYVRYATAGLLNEGCIWVTAGEAVADGDAVFVTPAGSYVKTAAGNIAIPAKFDTTAANGAIVRLRVTRN